jgi:uncharacterized protein YbjT (DUF2867 family)
MNIFLLGATGRTGMPLARIAIAEGHQVTAAARKQSEAAASLTKMGAKVIVGSVDEVLIQGSRGSDVVVSALAPGKDDVTLCSRVARAAVTAGVSRFVSISGAGLDVAGDEKNFEARMVSRIVRLVGGAAVKDKSLELEILQASSIEYTLARPPRLLSGQPANRFRVEMKTGPLSSKIDREDLARFLLEAVEHPGRYARQAPFVSW